MKILKIDFDKCDNCCECLRMLPDIFEQPGGIQIPDHRLDDELVKKSIRDVIDICSEGAISLI